jgi:hypothetical protein
VAIPGASDRRGRRGVCNQLLASGKWSYGGIKPACNMRRKSARRIKEHEHLPILVAGRQQHLND